MTYFTIPFFDRDLICEINSSLKYLTKTMYQIYKHKLCTTFNFTHSRKVNNLNILEFLEIISLNFSNIRPQSKVYINKIQGYKIFSIRKFWTDEEPGRLFGSFRYNLRLSHCVSYRKNLLWILRSDLDEGVCWNFSYYVIQFLWK